MKRKVLLVVLIFFVLLGATISGIFAYIYTSPKLNKAKLDNNQADIVLMDVQGNTISTKSKYVRLEDMVEYLPSAFVAIEDQRFYEHKGVDYRAIGRAVLHNIKAGATVEGGSTITQQLIKNTHLTQEKTFVRKIKEMSLARQLEKNYSKDEILEKYLNYIYFGNGIYGVGNASRYYYGKEVNELNLSEAVSLAAIVKNPAKYLLSEASGSQDNHQRSQLILSKLLEQGKISQAQYDEVKNEKPQLNITKIKGIADPYLDNALSEAATILGIKKQDVTKLGYDIYTYYDSEIQAATANAIEDKGLDAANEYGKYGDSYGIVLDNTTCGITAYYATFRENIQDFRRQPASLMKPIGVYAPCLEKGLLYPSTPILDEQITYGDYSPHNFNDVYHGWVTTEYALAHSLNAPAVKALSYLTVDGSKDYLEKVGITIDKEDKTQALALGGMKYGLTAPELLSAYAVFPNGGNYKRARFISRIVDNNGNIVFENSMPKEKVLRTENSQAMTYMLSETVNDGTQRLLKGLNLAVAGKTGTNSAINGTGNSDAYSLSFTTEHTALVWQGNLSQRAETNLSPKVMGGVYPTLKLKSILANIYSEYKPKAFDYSALKKIDIDSYSFEHEHLLLQCNPFTPTKYRMSVIMPDNATLAISDNFVLPDIDEVIVNQLSDGIKIDIITKNIYGVRVMRIDKNGARLLGEYMPNDCKLSICDTPDSGLVRYDITAYYCDGSYKVSGKTVSKTVYVKNALTLSPTHS